MKKSIYAKILSFLFVISLFSFTTTVQSCSKKPGFQTRNGGQKVSSSGKIGNQRHKNRHVWGK